MFGYSMYKTHYINRLVTGEKSTVYRNGTLVDLCRGPHIQNTGKIKYVLPSFILLPLRSYFLTIQSQDLQNHASELYVASLLVNYNSSSCLHLAQNSSAYFLGDQNSDSLQRIRAVAFPDKKLMSEHLKCKPFLLTTMLIVGY